MRDLVGRTSLRQLLAIVARARLVFGPDSGALHLAAAVGTPALSLWGATSAERSTPFGCEALSVAGDAPCAPCFLTRCPIGRVCMRTIDVETVVARAAAVAPGPPNGSAPAEPGGLTARRKTSDALATGQCWP